MSDQDSDDGGDTVNPGVVALQALMHDNEMMLRENLLLEAFLSKVDPSKVGAVVEDEGVKKKKSGSKKGKGPEVKKDVFLRLNDEEKNDLVTQEVELVQGEIATITKAGDKDIDDIKTLMEEVDMRIAETKKDTYEFKRDIIISAENPRTGKIMGEKMIRFMEDKLRQKDATTDKLRLKNVTIKALISKMEHQLAHKEEMGEVLHLVDFDQLKIENQQYMEKIEERNNELLRLKLSTSRTVQVLNNLKTQLSILVSAGAAIRKQIAERKTELQCFDSDMTAVADERTGAERTVRRLKLEQEDIDSPSIMGYIKLKHEVMELEKQATDWKRKMDILLMERARTRSLLKSVTITAGPGIKR
ncbi:MAG: hypothetical protein WDW36_003019 [Sanguina aurantia]